VRATEKMSFVKQVLHLMCDMLDLVKH